MFTGIISSIGIIESAEQQGDMRLKIACNFKTDALAPGASVSVNGACLTVVNKGLLASGKTYFTTTVSQETVSRTTPDLWQKDRKVNLEQSLKMGDSLDGHMVSGHIDGLSIVRAVTQAGDSYIMEMEAPENLLCYIAEKGSITLDGVSLTVNQVKDTRFWVNIIPHTWNSTTLNERQPGDRLNTEIDLIARYVARLLQK